MTISRSLLVVALLAFSAAILAQDDPMKTGDFVNGRFWENSTQAFKAGYLFGLRDGPVVLACDNRTEDRSSDAVKAAVGRFMQLHRGAKATLDELIDQIDAFYTDRANVRIPVSESYHYCMKRTLGASKKELDDLLTEMRSRAARF